MEDKEDKEDKAGAYQKGKEMLTKTIEAVQKGDLDELKRLLAEDTKEKLEEISEGKGRTLSHFAAISGQIPILEWIFANGGDPHVMDDDGNSIASVATYSERLPVLEYLYTSYPSLISHHNKKSMSLLHIAAESCNFQIVDFLLEKNLDINEVSENGTALELSVMWNKMEMARYLLGRGADPNGSKGMYFPPCIVMAASMNNAEAVNMLIDAGADIELTGTDEVTALEVACEFDFEFIDVLLEKGARLTGKVLQAAFKNNKSRVLDRFLSIEPVESVEVSNEKHGEADEMKNKGNEEFAKKDYEAAIKCYTRAIELSQVSIYYSNRSQAYIFVKKYNYAIEDARISRAIDPKNVKAYIREGQALSALGEHLQAAGCFWHALQLDTNPSISSLFLSTLSLII